MTGGKSSYWFISMFVEQDVLIVLRDVRLHCAHAWLNAISHVLIPLHCFHTTPFRTPHYVTGGGALLRMIRRHKLDLQIDR